MNNFYKLGSKITIECLKDIGEEYFVRDMIQRFISDIPYDKLLLLFNITKYDPREIDKYIWLKHEREKLEHLECEQMIEFILEKKI